METFMKVTGLKVKHGSGKMTYNNGKIYDGEWEKGEITKGKMTTKMEKPTKVNG